MSLDERKLELEVEKLRLDTDSVGRFASRIWPMIATMLTIVLSGIAVGVSMMAQRNQHIFEQEQRHRESLTEALKLATDASGQADRRIAGIWQLNNFWASRDDRQVLASVLAAELGLDDKYRFARCAAAEAIGRAMSTVAAEDRPLLAKLLFGSSRGDIGLVVQEHYLLLHSGAPTAATNDCQTALDATREAIRKNWYYLREVNLQGMDLSRTQFYSADLAGSLLMYSTLDKANFRCANLSQASFDWSNWPDARADFTLANVRDAVPRDFRSFAKEHGAIEMSDSEWTTWKKNGFRLSRHNGVLIPNMDASSVENGNYCLGTN
jgi:hypothetical protein